MRGAGLLGLGLLAMVWPGVTRARGSDGDETDPKVCDPAQERRLFDEREGAGLKLLVLQFSGDNKKERALGRAVSQRMVEALEDYRDAEGKSEVWKEAALRPEGFEIAIVGCAVKRHDEARQVGKAWGADVVLWGRVAIEDRRAPRNVQVQLKSSGQNGPVTMQNNQVSGDVNINVIRAIVRARFKDIWQGSLLSSITATRWDLLQARSATGKQLDSPIQIHNLQFPELAAGEPLGLLQFMMGTYVYQAQRYQLAAAYFDRATEDAYVSAAQAEPLYRMVGISYLTAGQPQKGMAALMEALRRCAREDDDCQARGLNNLGWGYNRLGEKQKALDHYAQALPLSRKVGDVSAEATTLNNIGTVYSDLGEKQKALDHYAQALPLFRKVGDVSGEAGTLNNIGLVYDDLGEKQKALEHYAQALPLFRKVGDVSGEATTLNNIGRVYSALGEKQKALEHYAQALPLFRKVGDVSGEAGTLNNIGGVYDDLGEKQKALEHYAQALPLARKVGDVSGEATTLNNIGLVYDDLGEKQKALEHYAQALPLERKVGDVSREATTLNNIGLVYDDLGEKRKALDHYAQALPLERKVGDVSREATILNNIGAVYDDLGEKQKALDHYAQALPLERKVGDVSREATTLNNIGRVYSALGEKQKALEHYAQALPLRRKVGDVSGEATTLNNIGGVYDALGEKQKALEHTAQALALFERIGERWSLAVVHDNRGRVLANLHRPQEAIAAYRAAADLYQKRPDRKKAYGSLDRALTVALRHSLPALARQLLTDMRPLGLSDLDAAWNEARITYLEGKPSEPAYRHLADLTATQPAETAANVERLAQAGLTRARAAADLAGCPGLLITQITPDSQAARLNLQVGDLLLRYQDQCLSVADDLIERTARTPPNTTVSLHILRTQGRNGHVETLPVHGGKLGVDITAF